MSAARELLRLVAPHVGPQEIEVTGVERVANESRWSLVIAGAGEGLRWRLEAAPGDVLQVASGFG